MKNRLNLADLATLAVTSAILALAVWMLTLGPTGPMPMHYGPDGTPDRWGDRIEAGMLIGTMGLLLGAMGWGFSHYARRTDDKARRRGLMAGQVVSVLTIGATTAFMTIMMAGADLPSPALQMGGVGMLFLAIGAFLGRVGPNVAVGIRTPWSYKSKLAWERSNRLAGRLFSLLGIGGLVAAPFAPQPIGVQVLFIGLMISAVWSVFESWRVWRADPDRQPF